MSRTPNRGTSCPQCGAVIASDAPFGQCPRCLLALGRLTGRSWPAAQEAMVAGQGRRFGDYELMEEVARGGMGVVFRAHQVSLCREVALKMILSGELASTELVQRFRNEAMAAARLEHPHIVPVYEIGEHDNQHYFTMRLIPGGRNIAAWEKDLNLPPKERARRVVQLLVKVARAVSFAHQHGVLHRDLKPSNILVDGHDEPCVVDFGISRRLELDAELTWTGQMVGTPRYMAPEHVGGSRRGLSTASDIYSLGAILYELLTGRKVFDGNDMLTLLRQVTESPPAPLLLGERGLERIVLCCLRKSPEDRYASAADLADDLERWLRLEPVLAAPGTSSPDQALWVFRHPRTSVLAVVSIAVVASLILFALSRDEPKSELPASPIASVGRSQEAQRLARRALEWFHDVNGPLGYIKLSDPAGRLTRVDAGKPLPPGDLEVRELWLDHWIPADEAKVKLPAITAAEFRTHAATLTKLRLCFLRDLNLIADDFTFLAQNPDLGSLTIENCQGGGDRLFAIIAPLERLRMLTLDNSEQPNDPLKGSNLHMLRCLPTLEAVLFMHCSFDDAGVSALVEQCPNIRRIGLAKTRITDASLRKLSRHALQELGLDGNPAITDAGLAELSKIPALKHLSVYECSNLTQAGIAAFRKAHPECNLGWEP
ncbi:MAG: protein kinase [Verrucomicrobiales bacterium]|nr:protein kinase [Verrucomicrobiales bacterium]